MGNIELMSETINFIQGSKRNYDSSTMQGGVYFSKDSPSNVINKIYNVIGGYQGLLLRDDNNTIYILHGDTFRILNMPNYLTTQRPESVNKGFCYFDSTLNKPIWWTGTKWVDSIGIDADSGSWITIE